VKCILLAFVLYLYMIYTAIPLAASALWDLGRECVMYTNLDAKSWFCSVFNQFVHIYMDKTMHLLKRLSISLIVCSAQVSKSK
jgi:hypothetical protein